MKCELIRDLLPLYADGLCSEETNAQVEAHLEACEECRQKLAHYRANVGEEQKLAAEDPSAIHPMKKVRTKLRRRKWLSVTLCVLLCIVAAGLGVLTIGEINGHKVSFSTCGNIIRLNYITHQLTKGNTDVLLDALSFRWEDRYAVKGASNFETMAAYKAQLKQQMDEAYAHYFEGKEISVKLSSVESYIDSAGNEGENYFMTSPNTYCYDFYDGENLVLSMWFISRDGKFTVQEYGLDQVSAEQCPSFVSGMLPMDELLKDIVRYGVKGRYNNFSETGKTYETTPLKLLFRQFSAETDESYKEHLDTRTAALYEEGWALKEFVYAVDTYNEELGHWFYKLWFVYENPETGENCMAEQSFMSHDAYLYPVEEQPAVILQCAESVPTENREQILNFLE